MIEVDSTFVAGAACALLVAYWLGYFARGWIGAVGYRRGRADGYEQRVREELRR